MKVTRRSLMLGAATLAISIQNTWGGWFPLAGASPAPPTGNKLSVNTDAIGDVVRDHPPFIRWDRHSPLGGAGAFNTKLTVSAVNYAGTQLFDQGYVDANYELIDPLPSGSTAFQIQVFALGASLTNRQSLSGVNMKCTWTGGAAISSITLGGDANNNKVVDLAGRNVTFTMKATSGAPQGGFCTDNSWLVFNFSGTAGPPRNIRLFEAAYESRLLAGEIFDPVWLTAMKDYDVLRLMDFMHTNGSLARDYADIATDSFLTFRNGASGTDSTTGLTNGLKCGPSVATICALANQSLRPIWICIPHQFTDAAITSYATALRDGVSPSIPIYVEYTNEAAWNFEITYTRAQGALISAWSGTDTIIRGNQFVGLRAAEVMSIFRNVFGTNSGNRWIGVLGAQLAGTLTARLVGLDYFLNPANSLLRAGDTSTTLFSHVAGAPYIGPTPTTTASGAGLVLKPYIDAGDQAAFNTFMYDQIKYAAPSSGVFKNTAYYRPFWQTMIAAAAARGWTMVMYEGGNGATVALPLRDNNSGETQGTAFNLAFMKFADSAEAGLLHTEMYALYLADGGFKPNKFNAIDQHSKFGPWGAQQNFSDNNACYQALSAFNTA